MPERESLNATDRAAAPPAARRPSRYGIGCGLPWANSSPMTIAMKRSGDAQSVQQHLGIQARRVRYRDHGDAGAIGAGKQRHQAGQRLDFPGNQLAELASFSPMIAAWRSGGSSLRKRAPIEALEKP